MLSLGYPRVNFQLADKNSYSELLELVQEKLSTAGKRKSSAMPALASTVDAKQRAFKVQLHL